MTLFVLFNDSIMNPTEELSARAKPFDRIETSMQFASPLVTRERWAEMLGVPVGVIVAQADRGYWPQVTIGKRVFINVEVVRLKAAERAQEFSL